MDLVATPSQQRPHTRPTPRDSCTTRTTVRPQALPQEKNIRLGDYVQIRLWPTDKTAEARKKSSVVGIGCSTRGQLSSKVGEGTQVTTI